MSEITKRLRRMGSPFWRLYLFGVIELLIAGLTVSFVFRFVFDIDEPPWEKYPERIIELLSATFENGEPDTAALQARLTTIHELVPSNMAVYDVAGNRLAAAGDTPPPPLVVGEKLPSKEKEYSISGKRYTVCPLRNASAYLVVDRIQFGADPPMQYPLITILSVLVAMALITIPLAYGATLPFTKMNETAKKLAAGDLSARIGITRGGIGSLASTIDNIAARLEERIRTERELIANISHEIRTPMARIRVAQELSMEEGSSIEEIRSLLSGIGEDVQELDRLVDDVLKTSRLDLASTGSSVDFALERAPTLISEVIGIAALRFTTAHPNHALEIRVKEELPTVSVDKSLVRRVLDNLLDNAAKYSDVDRPIEVDASSGSGHIQVEISDRGIGVDEQDLDRIFNPFFRTEKGKTRYVEGTGLGLALCRRIVEAHGGAISARARDGGGLSISFTLPLDQDSAEIDY